MSGAGSGGRDPNTLRSDSGLFSAADIMKAMQAQGGPPAAPAAPAPAPPPPGDLKCSDSGLFSAEDIMKAMQARAGAAPAPAAPAAAPFGAPPSPGYGYGPAPGYGTVPAPVPGYGPGPAPGYGPGLGPGYGPGPGPGYGPGPGPGYGGSISMDGVGFSDISTPPVPRVQLVNGTIEFFCTCNQPLRAAEAFKGRKVKCPACQSIQVVPDPASFAAPPAHPVNIGAAGMGGMAGGPGPSLTFSDLDAPPAPGAGPAAGGGGAEPDFLNDVLGIGNRPSPVTPPSKMGLKPVAPGSAPTGRPSDVLMTASKMGIKPVKLDAGASRMGMKAATVATQGIAPRAKNGPGAAVDETRKFLDDEPETERSNLTLIILGILAVVVGLVAWYVLSAAEPAPPVDPFNPIP